MSDRPSCGLRRRAPVSTGSRDCPVLRCCCSAAPRWLRSRCWSPRRTSSPMLLQAANIRAPAFPRRPWPQLCSDHWMLALAMPLAVVVLGVRLLVTRPLVERMVLAIAAAMVFVTVAVNVVVVPAIANTLSLKDFTDHAMKVVDDSSVGYLDALNYDVAFYSRRTIPIVSQRDPDLPAVPDRLAHSLRRAPRVEAQPFRHRDGLQPDFARRHRRDAPAPPARRFSNPTIQTFRRLHPSEDV